MFISNDESFTYKCLCPTPFIFLFKRIYKTKPEGSFPGFSSLQKKISQMPALQLFPHKKGLVPFSACFQLTSFISGRRGAV